MDKALQGSRNMLYPKSNLKKGLVGVGRRSSKGLNEIINFFENFMYFIVYNYIDHTFFQHGPTKKILM